MCCQYFWCVDHMSDGEMVLDQIFWQIDFSAIKKLTPYEWHPLQSITIKQMCCSIGQQFWCVDQMSDGQMFLDQIFSQIDFSAIKN
jgi:hypothetical protein